MENISENTVISKLINFEKGVMFLMYRGKYGIIKEGQETKYTDTRVKFFK